MKKGTLHMLAATVVAGTLFTGCSRDAGTPPVAPPAKPVVDTSFDEVGRHLDSGGNLYLYMDTVHLLKAATNKWSQLKDLAFSTPGGDPAERAEIEKAVAIFEDIAANSGFQSIDGVGLSGIEQADGLTRTRAILHHGKGDGAGYLWTAFGDKPHALDALDLLPADTAFASFYDLNAGMIFKEIRKQAARFPEKEVGAQVEQFEGMAGAMLGKPLEEFLGDFAGQYGIFFTLSATNSVPLPIPSADGSAPRMPAPGLAIAIRVNSDSVFTNIDARLSKDDGWMKKDEINGRFRTLAIPLPVPFPVLPTIAQIPGWLVLASTDSLAREIAATKAGTVDSLKSTAEFKKLAAGMPAKGNGFAYISPRLGKAISEVQMAAIKARAGANGGLPPDAMKRLTQMFSADNVSAMNYVVIANEEEGWTATSTGNQQPAGLVLAAGVAPAAIAAGMALPAIAKAREKARDVKCKNNLRMLETAQEQWAAETGAKAGDPVSMDKLKPYLFGDAPECPLGGSYSVTVVGEKPTCSHTRH